MTRWLTMIGVLVALVSVALGATAAHFFLREVLFLEAPRITYLPNHVQLFSTRKSNELAYNVVLNEPRNFQSFVMVYDPLVVNFDAFIVHTQYYSYKSRRPPVRQVTKGKAQANEPGKMALVLATGYTHRLSNRSPTYIRSITVQFFALNRDNDTTFLQTFNALRTQAEFRVYRPGSMAYDVLRKDPASRGWNRDAFRV